MQSCDEFKKIFWNQYISIEKEFLDTIHYVALSEENYSVYSDEYAKLLLQIGSEIDIALKYYCKILDTSFEGERICDYKKSIRKCDKNFVKQEIQCLFEKSIRLYPWECWSANKGSPYWWTAYNKVKHCRNEVGIIEDKNEEKQYFKFANLKYTLHSLAALYHIWLCSYYQLAIAEGETLLLPLPASRVFKAAGSKWETTGFYGDFALYLKDGCLYMEHGMPYN